MGFLIFIAKSSLALALFYCCFQILLRNETFFKANRWFLLVGVVVALVFPFLIITKVVFVNAPLLDFSNLQDSVVNQPKEKIDWWFIALLLYIVGCVFFFIRFVIQLLSLYSLLKKGKSTRVNGFTMVEVTEDTSAFSFFNYIVYNPSLHTEKELKTILEHEQLHAIQKHSLDMLFTHLLCVLQWVNPFAWWYKKLVSVNLEYLVDNTIVSNQNKKEYQYLLLQQSVHSVASLSLTNPFFSSLVKKRIVMLNKSKSKKYNMLKMGVVLPVLLVATLTLNTQVVAQTKPTIDNKETPTKPLLNIVADSILPKKIATKTTQIISKQPVSKRVTPNIKPKTQRDSVKTVQNKYNFQIVTNDTLKLKPVSMTTPIREVKTPENSYLRSKKPLIIINGEVMPSSFDMNLLIPENIEHINIFKNQSAIDRFGKKGENGVVEIITKK